VSREKHTANPPEALARRLEGFAAHLRDPKGVAPPDDVEDRRMAIYRRLFFNNLKRMLAANFPVLRRLHSESGWDRLIREFFVEHRCHTPLFPELPREFLQYLQGGREAREGDPPFLLELAHYEWVELALGIDDTDLDTVRAQADGNLLEGVPVLSPLAWPLAYRYPVHRIGPDFRPAEPPAQPTHLLVYRNRQDTVRFMELNAVSATLLRRMQETPDRPGLVLLKEVATAIGHPNPETVIEGGRRLLEDLCARDVILGTR
jgi:hypothetical protein